MIAEPPPYRTSRCRAVERARLDLACFAVMMIPTWRAGRLHRYLCTVLERFARGDITRLIITVPPQHGKSVLVSQVMAAWMMGHDPTQKLCLVSYSQERSTGNSVACKDLMGTPVYRQVFPDTSGELRGGIEAWETAGGGGYRAVGIGGSITGFPVDTAIIDDPIKNVEEAFSEAQRQKVWDSLNTAVMTRASPRFRVAIIMTRWHVDDPVGRATGEAHRRELLAIGAEPYTVINIPSICDSEEDPLGRQIGETIWPERYSRVHYDWQRVQLTPFMFSAMHQGRPTLLAGNLVSREKFILEDYMPQDPRVRWCRFWDLATTTKQTSDYTAGPLLGLDLAGDLWLADIKRGRWEWPMARQIISDVARGDKLPVIVEENGAGKAAVPDIRAALAGEIPVYGVDVAVDKLSRALGWIAKAHAGKFHVLRADWNDAFFDEVQSFPKGTHDDQCDGLSGAYAQLVSFSVDNSPPVGLTGPATEHLW